ncbi:unnamed protein product, partial [Closterium sp. NIES-53]
GPDVTKSGTVGPAVQTTEHIAQTETISTPQQLAQPVAAQTTHFTAGGGEDAASLLELARQEDHALPASAQQRSQQKASQLEVAQAESARGHAAAAAGSGATAAATAEGGAAAAAAAAVGGEAGSGAGQGGQAYPDKEPQPFPWRERQQHLPEKDQQQQFPERDQQPFPEREPHPFPEREHQQFPGKIPHGSGVFGEEGVDGDRPGGEEEKRTEVKGSVGQGKEDEDEDGKDGDEGDEEKEEKEEKEEEEEKDAGGKSEGEHKGNDEEGEEGSGEGEAGGKKEKKAGDKGESEDEEDGEDDEEDEEEEGGGKEGKKGRSEAGTGSGKKAQDEEGEKKDEEDEEEKEEEKEAKEEEEGSHSSGEGAGEEDEGAGPADDSAAAGGDGGGSEGESGSSGGGEATGESAGSSEQQSVAAKEVVSAAFPLSSRRKAEEAAAVAAGLVGEPIDVEGFRGHTVFLRKPPLPFTFSPFPHLSPSALLGSRHSESGGSSGSGGPGGRADRRGGVSGTHGVPPQADPSPSPPSLSPTPLHPFPLPPVSHPRKRRRQQWQRIQAAPATLTEQISSSSSSPTSPSSLSSPSSQYALVEMVSHYRLRKAYKGSTSDTERADLFFMPFHLVSLPILRVCQYALEMVFHYRLRNTGRTCSSSPSTPCHPLPPSFLALWLALHTGDGVSLPPVQGIQYALEMVFHYRLRKAYKCITSDPDRADLFFIPFYASLDVTRWHFAKNASLDDRDRMHDGLAKWLMRREHFKKRSGADHFIVLGQGSWDFRRSEGSQWGNRLLLLPEMKHVTKLVLAANLWEETEIGIPPLTFFHPRWEKDYKPPQGLGLGAAADLHAARGAHGSLHRCRLLHHLLGPHGRPQSRLGLGAAADLHAARGFYALCTAVAGVYGRDLHASRGAPMRASGLSSRRLNRAQLSFPSPPHVRYLECVEDICTRPEVLMDLFTDAAFCIVPSGHTGARRAAFDAIVAGCIPVFLDSFVPSQVTSAWV